MTILKTTVQMSPDRFNENIHILKFAIQVSLDEPWFDHPHSRALTKIIDTCFEGTQIVVGDESEAPGNIIFIHSKQVFRGDGEIVLIQAKKHSGRSMTRKEFDSVVSHVTMSCKQAIDAARML